jgi:hypothetical protein
MPPPSRRSAAVPARPIWVASSGAWSRNRLLAVLATAGVVALVLAVGLGYAVYLAVDSVTTSATDPSHGGPSRLSRQEMFSETALGQAHRDQVAGQPMLTVDADAMKPTTPTTRLAGRITIPEATGIGAGGVPTGFPHTPEGALGQLAALGQTVIGAMSISVAHHMYDDWAMPGGVGADRWLLTTNVASFLGAAGMGPTLSPGATVSAISTGAQVKGTDGPDWTLACVLFEVDAIISAQSSIGYGICERMQWNPDHEIVTDPETGAEPAGGRWMIGPGTPPALAPNTWPGSAAALDAGWLTWTTEDDASLAAN